jgi:hypothetical protein
MTIFSAFSAGFGGALRVVLKVSPAALATLTARQSCTLTVSICMLRSGY